MSYDYGQLLGKYFDIVLVYEISAGDKFMSACLNLYFKHAVEHYAVYNVHNQFAELNVKLAILNINTCLLITFVQDMLY